MENTGTFLTTLDFVVFFSSLLGVMALGLWAGRNESSSKDYFLAGRNVRWWGVAGSIFGSNISANHMVGMMGVGFTLGFAESHFEITAIAGLLLLCYCFLPVYRKLNIYTLSDYLSRRYDDKSRVAYSVIMVLIITMVMMLPAFYIGSRSVNFLLVDQAHINEVLKVSASGAAQTIEIDKTYYILGVLIMALVTGVYTIVGGLKAVIVTDVLQSVLMLAGALIVAWFTFNSVEIGGWDGMRALDAKGKDLVHLYLPSDHPQRPWSGMLSGLMVLHFYYWGANQFIVQRALAAKTDKEARVGIITAGFVKLLIPFISIGTGIAAYYVFAERMPGVQVDGDTAFPLLLREVVAPAGIAGLVGLVAAGLIGAILSSVDSMMSSAATLIVRFLQTIRQPGGHRQAIDPDRTGADRRDGNRVRSVDDRRVRPEYEAALFHLRRIASVKAGWWRGGGFWCRDAVERGDGGRRLCVDHHRRGGFLCGGSRLRGDAREDRVFLRHVRHKPELLPRSIRRCNFRYLGQCHRQ